MSSEVGSIGGACDQYAVESDSSYAIPESDQTLHESIFSQEYDDRPFTRRATLQTTPSQCVQSAQQIARNNGITLAKVQGSGEVGGRLDWGGKNGSTFSGYAKGEVYDDKGNSAAAKIEQNSDGTGSATASVKHTEKPKERS